MEDLLVFSGAGGVSNFIGATASWTFLERAHRCLDRNGGFSTIGLSSHSTESRLEKGQEANL